jgi:hypothetical protein
MLKIAHLLAGLIAILMTATFLTASVLVELFGTWELIVLVKNLIVSPGLFILALTIIVSGMTGLQLSHTQRGERVAAKQARMLLIAANSLMLSLPAALHLQHLAALGTFNTLFYLIQAVELWAGVVNLILMSLNIRDGLRLSGKI